MLFRCLVRIAILQLGRNDSRDKTPCILVRPWATPSGLLAQLAADDGAKPLSSREICKRTDMPERFVLTILRTLARAGVVVAPRGIKGGYKLAKPPGSDFSSGDMR